MSSTTKAMTFFDSEKFVDVFLKVVDKNFEVDDQVEVQCALSLTNFQRPQDEFSAEIIDQRSWLIDVYPCVYFNEFVTYSLKQDILKRVIINGITGSSWRFKRFNKLNII